jgi:hypothetical protein
MSLEGQGDVPDEIRELCQSCIEYVKRTVDFELDYSLETLPAVDEYARQVREEIEERPEVLPLVSRAVGAYFGEVLRRNLNGFWRLPSANINDWQLCMHTAFLWINPVGAACDALAGHDEHGGPSSPIRVAPEDRDLVKDRLGSLPDMEPEDYYMLSTRAEVLGLVLETLHASMEAKGYSEETFQASDYEAELRPLGSA